MADRVPLPPFVPPTDGWDDSLKVYTAAELEAYGDARRAAALEEALDLCRQIESHKGERFFGELVSDGSAAQCVRAIEAMKDKP